MKTLPPINIHTEREYRHFRMPHADISQHPELTKRICAFWNDVGPFFLDMAQPLVRITDAGENVQMLWFNRKRTKALIVHLGAEFHADGRFRVTEERLRRHGMTLPEPEVIEKGNLNMQETIPLALHMTDWYRPSSWLPTSFVKHAGPWTLEMHVERGQRRPTTIVATLRRHGNVVHERRHYTWEDASRSLHQGMGKFIRDQRNQERTSQYARNYLKMREELSHGVGAK